MDLKVLEESYILSIRYGHLDIFYLFHGKLKNKNPTRLGSTALHKAVKYNRILMFGLIYQNPNCLFKEDKVGYFPIQLGYQER